MIKTILFSVFVFLLGFKSHSQSLEERDVKEIKSKSRLIVKEFEGLLNLISNNQMYDSEIEEIITNSLDPNNVNKLFKDSKIIVEDDVNPDLISRKRNVEISSYLSNFNLQYNKTDEYSIVLEDIEISDVFQRKNYFVIATCTREFNSTFSKENKSYSPLQWNIELEVSKNSAGKWTVAIAGLTNSNPPDFLSLEKFKVEVAKSS